MADLYRRIGRISGLKVGILAIVLTLPPEIQTDDPKRLAGLRKAARDVLRSWVASVNGLELATRTRPGWSLTGVDTYHAAGDKDPDKFTPHIHAQIPAIAWWRPSGELDDRPSWKALRFKVTEEDLYDLRCRWGLVLADAGWSCRRTMCGEAILDKCVVHYRWFSGGDSPKFKGQLEHRIRYDFRHWPEWKATWRKIIWWGYAAPASQPKVGIEALEDEDRPELKDEEPTICPKCGQTAEWSADIGRDPDKLRRKRTRRKTLDLVGAPEWVNETRHVRWYDPPPEYLPHPNDRRFK